MEELRVEALASLSSETQAKLGQHFTPRLAAELLATMPRCTEQDRVSVLDPGAGSGMLMAAAIHRLVKEARPKSIDVAAVEVDDHLLGWLRVAADECTSWAAAQGCEVTVRVVNEDLILTSGTLDQPDLAGLYDLVIMNPPYAKLPVRSSHRRAMAARGLDCPNLYAAFVALGVDALRDGGQIVAITPRSFANGPYFETFRKHFLNTVAIDRIHTFESRDTVFSESGVLQENIVFSATRCGERRAVRLTESNGHLDIGASGRSVAYDVLVQPADPHQFIRLGSAADAEIGKAMAALPATIRDLGLQVSTGRVVDFRARDNLRDSPDEACVPLLYPGNLRGGLVEWPRDIRKPQGFAILRPEHVQKALIPSGYYVLVKRFSAKEERRRVVAAVWDPTARDETSIAVENHLNVVHDNGRGLSPEVAWGLSAWLNSTLVDRYFRTFSGHTQVNATDLRTLPFPTLEALRQLGAACTGALPSQAEIDERVAAATGLRAPA